MSRRLRRSMALVLFLCPVLTPAAWSQEKTAPEGLSEGARLAEQCASCHALTSGGAERWGPGLFGVVDRPVGAEAEYRYGPYLRAQGAAGATWSEEALREWLVDSKAVARAANARTKMPAQHLTDDEINALLRYLKTLR